MKFYCRSKYFFFFSAHVMELVPCILASDGLSCDAARQGEYVFQGDGSLCCIFIDLAEPIHPLCWVCWEGVWAVLCLQPFGH